jgi:hypothetical protein
MESRASFAERAKEVGIEEALLTKLVAAGLDTFNKLAYICAANPTSGDDAKLKQAFEDLLGQEVTAINMISFRQLVDLMAQLVWRHSCGADRLPVVVRFPTGP